MKILIYGAGVIGTLHAWAFERAGHQVSLLVRPGHEDRWASGIELRVLDARGGRTKKVDALYQPRIVTSFTANDGYDAIVETVRYTQTEEALPELAANLGDAILLLFNNNWRGLDLVDRVLSKERYVLGLPRAGGVISNGVLDGAIEGRAILGPSTCGRPAPPAVAAAARENLDSIAGLLRSAGFEPEIQENMEHWYWIHFAATAAWTGAAVKEGGLDSLSRSTKAVQAALFAGREAMEICRARGADVRRIGEARRFLAPPWLTAPVVRRAITGEMTRRLAQTHAEYAPEFRRFFDDVVETGHRLQVPTPHLDAYQPFVDR